MGKGLPPVVTGISPAEGPPGTVVKIRGEHLGNSAKDILKVFIGAKNVTYTVDWKNSRLIQARTSSHQGMGDIIISTKSGGVGSSMVNFRGYSPRVGLLTEAAVWVDESKLFEDKPSSTLSNSRMFSPNVTTYTDPLGVAPEETGAVLSPDLIEEWYKGTSSNPLSEDFNPSRFLLERHLDTGFSALKSGYYHLQSQDTRTSVGPTSFVRGNLTTILNALTTLNDIQKILLQHESESIEGDICKEMQGIIYSCNSASVSLFKDILTRKDDSDAKRNVLNVLHRYRFLFNLPRSIEKNIQQGEYEILISDFNRAKSLFQNTEVNSFQKALAEVDQKISVFADQLKKKLFDFPTPLEEQKKMIRYLNDLDYTGNAGWECITKQSQWIKTMLVDCQVRYKSDDNIEDIKTITKSSMDFKVNNIVASPVSQGLLMVEDLCKLISEHLTELWNLGQTYLSNQLGDKRNPLEKSENVREKFLDLVKEVVAVFCEITDSILHPFDKRLEIADTSKFNALVQWLPDGVNAVRSTLEKIDNLGLTEDVILPLKTLTMNSIADCVNKVLSSSVSEIQKLAKEEKWELNRTEKEYSTSELPYKFETIFIESLKFVHDFMKDSKSDSKSVLQKDIVPILKEMFVEFLKALEMTVYNTEVKNERSAMSSDINHSGGEAMSKDLQVIVGLSNCYHLKVVIVPRIMTQCVKFGYEELKDFQKEIDETIEKLDKRIFMTYIEMKGEPIIGAIEVGINMGEYSWDNTQGNNNVRQYVQDILMKLISTHNQVSSISTLFINRIFTLLVEMISGELLRIYECIDKFSQEGGLQAALEINVLTTALENYMSKKARHNFVRTADFIPSLEDDDERNMKEIMDLFNSTMWYQVSAFSMGEEKISSKNHDN